jgi:hypothetical protein
MDPTVEYRFNKVDDAIQKLASVAGDISKLIAVHDQRITQQEKITEHTSEVLEKRREDFELKLNEVYETIYKETNEIKKTSSYQHSALVTKIASIERFVWMACGGGTVVGYLISLAVTFLKNMPVAH